MTHSIDSVKSSRLFNAISWVVTALVVAGLIGFTFLKISPQQVSAAPAPTAMPEGEPATLPVLTSNHSSEQGIVRQVTLNTEIDTSINYKVGKYTVRSGDALFSIAQAFNIKPETLLWGNYNLLQDNPDNLVVGQTLNIPPVDGIYYQWKEGDTLDSVASKLDADPEDILNWPGNSFDLTNPVIAAGTYVMVPGGKGEPIQWIRPQVARGRSGTSSLSGRVCDGPYGTGGFIWPTIGRFITNYYSSSHLAIDIAESTGAPIYASDSGVVVTAGWNSSGYGNVIMVDHGNGYSTVYAHLSQINVTLCQGVIQGQVIGLEGSTGNSTGAHLHFEVRLNGGYVNPLYVLP